MGASYLVYGEDAYEDPKTGETTDNRRNLRLITRDLNEALAEFMKIVAEEEHGSLEWSS